jgi:hypothetical protein
VSVGVREVRVELPAWVHALPGFTSGAVVLLESTNRSGDRSLDRSQDSFVDLPSTEELIRRWEAIAPSLAQAKTHAFLFLPPKPDSARDPARGSEREEEWRLSRWALLEAIERCSKDGVVALSLSHSQSEGKIRAAAAFCVSFKGGASALPHRLGIGIDLESGDRVMSPRAASRVSKEEELALGFSPLEIWCLKEAAFKARSNAAIRADSSYTEGVMTDFQCALFSRDRADGLRISDQTGETLSMRGDLTAAGKWLLGFALFV